MQKAFSGYHPTVHLLFFLSVMLITMFIAHPVFSSASFLCSLIYAMYAGGKKALKITLLMIIPMAVLIAVINPLFNHAGITILFYLYDGNPFTLESLVYGIFSGIAFSAIMLWCLCLRYTASTDGVLYLFGRISPKLSLLISMILRFIPKFTAQFRTTCAAQKCIGRGADQGNIFRRIHNAVRITSSVIGWTIENSVETADSLRSRGYGLRHRGSYSLFCFEGRDAAAIAVICICGISSFVCALSEKTEFFYFPMISPVETGLTDILVYASFFILCLLPSFVGIKEDRKWKYLRSDL